MLNVVMRYYDIPVQYWEFSRRRISDGEKERIVGTNGTERAGLELS